MIITAYIAVVALLAAIGWEDLASPKARGFTLVA